MESKKLKEIFDETAKAKSFEKKFNGWFKESDECICVLDLQKSNYADYYDLNIKIFIQGLFGKKYHPNKELVKKDTGDVFRRLPEEFKDVLNLSLLISEHERQVKLKYLFENFIEPFVLKANTKSGLIELAREERIFLLPAVRTELNTMISK
jgi:hypothetical protein